MILQKYTKLHPIEISFWIDTDLCRQHTFFMKINALRGRLHIYSEKRPTGIIWLLCCVRYVVTDKAIRMQRMHRMHILQAPFSPHQPVSSALKAGRSAGKNAHLPSPRQYWIQWHFTSPAVGSLLLYTVYRSVVLMKHLSPLLSSPPLPSTP